tara:strand:+ start:696 stop:971 length:276 start_codon:yes stop_codon:yes gene_type:complete
MKTKREEMLTTAGALISGDREADYGKPQRNFRHIAERWSQHLGITVEPWQVAIMMADLKIARMASLSKYHNDSTLDIIGYAALAGELADEE